MLKKEIIEKIKESHQIKGALISENRVSERTLLRWLQLNDSKLSLNHNVKLIEKLLKTKNILED